MVPGSRAGAGASQLHTNRRRRCAIVAIVAVAAVGGALPFAALATLAAAATSPLDTANAALTAARRMAQ